MCGDRGPFAVFDMEQPPGSIATDLQVRGQLLGDVKSAAKQELVCVAVSDSICGLFGCQFDVKRTFYRRACKRICSAVLDSVPSSADAASAESAKVFANMSACRFAAWRRFVAVVAHE